MPFSIVFFNALYVQQTGKFGVESLQQRLTDLDDGGKESTDARLNTGDGHCENAQVH